MIGFRAAVIATSIVLLSAISAASEETCTKCHGKEGRRFEQGLHAPVGVTCVDCHGGDPSLLSKEACVDNPGFLGVPDGKEITETCGECHSDIDMMRQYRLPTNVLALYRTSPHGKRLYEENDPNVPTCIDCHGTHGILPASDPESPVYRSNVPQICAGCHADEEKMKPYGLSATVYKDYSESVHGKGLIQEKELGLPHCGDCHSSHGAKPAGVREVINVCGHCHMATRDHFRRSRHFQAGEQGLMEECTSCHEHHAVRQSAELAEPDAHERLCGQCHDSSDPADAGARTAREMRSVVDAFREEIEQASARIHQARGSGIHIEEEEGYLNEARHLLTMTGPISHSASLEELQDLANQGSAVLRRAEESVDLKLRKVRDRRILTTLTFAFIVLIVLLLYIKMRRIRAAAGY